MILIVTYDLKTRRDYGPLYAALQRQGSWWHYLTSTWLISTSNNPQQVFEAIHPFMDPQDFVFVAELGNQYQGWLPKEAWEWINAQGGATGFYTSAAVSTAPPSPPVPPFLGKA